MNIILEISFANIDFKSILVCVVGIGVVFTALALLVIVFTNIPRIGRFFIKVKLHGFKGALGLTDKKRNRG